MIDALIVALLFAGFVYAYLLSRKVEKLGTALKEIGPALQSFSDAVDRSQKSVDDLKKISSGLPNDTSRPARRSNHGTPRATKDDLISNFFSKAGRRRG